MEILMRSLTFCIFTSIALVSCGSNFDADDSASDQEVVEIDVESIDFHDKECAEKNLPVAITFKNVGKSESKTISWDFSVKRRGFSDEMAIADSLYAIRDPDRRTDKIILPGQIYKVCSSAPNISNSEIYSEEFEWRVFVESPAHQ